MCGRPATRRLIRNLTRGCLRRVVSRITRPCTPVVPLPPYLRLPSDVRILNVILAMLEPPEKRRAHHLAAFERLEFKFQLLKALESAERKRYLPPPLRLAA